MKKITHKPPRFTPVASVCDELTGVDYESTSEGLYKVTKAHGQNRIRIGEAVEVLAIGSREDENNPETSLFFRFKHQDGEWRYKRIRAGALVNGDLVAKALLDAGYSLEDTGTARKRLIADYLNTVYKRKYAHLSKVVMVERVGWLDDSFSVYVRPDEVITSEKSQKHFVFCPLLDDKAALSSWLEVEADTSGTLEEWQKTIASIALHSSRVVLALCAAFAAPLLNPLRAESTAFHFVGVSSIGKSAMLNAACSVWGSRDDYLSNWGTTVSALETWAAGLSDCVGIKDEWAQASAEVAEAVPYLIGNEHGKERATADLKKRETARFKLLLLSSGEIGLVEKRAKARIAEGEYNRFVDIPACGDSSQFGVFDSLPEGITSGAVVANQIFENSRRFYGVAARHFVCSLIDHIKRKGVNSFRQEYARFEERFLKDVSAFDSSTYQRMAKRFAVVAFAGSLAERFGVLDWEGGTAFRNTVDCFRLWRSGGSSPEARANDILTAIRDYAARFGSKFREYYRSDPTTQTNADGFETLGTVIKDEKGRIQFLALSSNALKSILKEIDGQSLRDALGVILGHYPAALVVTERNQFKPMADPPAFGLVRGVRVYAFYFGVLDEETPLTPIEAKEALSRREVQSKW